MTKEIENLIRKSTLRDVHIYMLKRTQDGLIINEEVMLEILKELEPK